MKVTRRHLRRLIESVINEQENPGSKLASAVKKGEQNKSDANKQEATQELQKTYDWFERVVFPAIEDDAWPIVADDDYHTMRYPMFTKDMMKMGMIPKGTKFKSLQDAPVKGDGSPTHYQTGMTIVDFYAKLEDSVKDEKLSVTMQSDQPDEFEEEVEKSKKEKMNESLSRGSLYRRRYRRY